MAKRPSVGTSWHTIAKHGLFIEFVAREVRVANHPNLDWINRLVWFDLTAGNAVPAYDAPWHTACSPGILAFQAAQSVKRTLVALYERDPAIYAQLLESLERHLPGLGYEQMGDRVWRIGDRVLLWANNEDGRVAKTSELRVNDAVLVLNDPNAITGWAMRPGFAAEILEQQHCKGLRILSTLGCNVNGILRTPLRRASDDGSEAMSLNERTAWFDLVNEQKLILPRRHDMLLTSFERDRDKWAYMLWQPDKPRWRDDAESDVRKAFASAGRAGAMAWFRTDPAGFRRMQDELFLTQRERDEQANSPLFGPGPEAA